MEIIFNIVLFTFNIYFYYTTVLLEIHYLSLRLCFKILLCCFFMYSKLKCNYSKPCKTIYRNIGLSMNCNYKKGDFYEIARTLY